MYDMEVYDAVLMLTESKLHILSVAKDYLVKNLGASRIVIVTKRDCFDKINEIVGCDKRFLIMDEDELYPQLTYSRIAEVLNTICGKTQRAGWFFQQFLKMAYSFVTNRKYYLVFDADTVPLTPIPYFDECGKPQFITKKEFCKSYFDTLDVLFNGEVHRVEQQVSYIAENMIINTGIMREIIRRIENDGRLSGDVFFERILYAIDKNVVHVTGFSEFETYGNYVMTFYPQMYNRVSLRTQRLGTFLLGSQPDKEQLDWASDSYDIISFEDHGKSWLKNKTQKNEIRSKYTAKEMFDRYHKISNFVDRLLLRPVVEID